MRLIDLMERLRSFNVKIAMLNQNDCAATTIFEGKSEFFRMSNDEAQLSVLWVSPHRYSTGGLFIMVDDPYKYMAKENR